MDKSHADEKAKAIKNSKKRDTSSEVLDELHLLEVKEAAARRVEKHRIREKELDLAAKKQEFEKEKHKAKVRKMELEAKKTEQQFNLMRLMLSRNMGGGFLILRLNRRWQVRAQVQVCLVTYTHRLQPHAQDLELIKVTGVWMQRGFLRCR